MFTLLNRERFDPVHDHPLLTQNPYQLVPFLKIDLCSDDINIPDLSSLPPPRLISTHMPYVSSPKSAESRPCKIEYIRRNPKDNFVSLWHFTSKLRAPELGRNSSAEAFDMFCKGVTPYGPYWDHVLQYWKQSKEEPCRVLFLKYEDMRKKFEIHLRRFGGVSGLPF